MTARVGSEQDLRGVAFVHGTEVDNLIKTENAAIWPCKLPSIHKQLKNYISTSSKDLLYYAHKQEVYAIHIPTNRQQLLATLPFSPTCIAAGYGWICLGGYDEGRCAFIDVRNCPPFGSSQSSAATEVDELLPLDLDPLSRLFGQSSPIDSTSRRQRPKITTRKIGSFIVNNITISQFTHDQEDLPNETVAVLSNNDKTVTVYSLTQQAVLKVIALAKEINHSSISPDGELLVAVGDVNKVWFYQRSIRKRAQPDERYDWNRIAVIQLVCTTQSDWCFSTAWSPSGNLCAVASQFGTITVFDVSKINEDMDERSAIVCCFKSSRPTNTDPQSSIPTAPRSMAFSPGPWDLLAWAEDHGRVTVADIRDGFSSRQTIEIDVLSDKVEQIEYAATPTESEIAQERSAMFIQRHREALEADDPEAAVQHAAEYMEDAALRVRTSRSTPIYMNNQELPQSILTDSERELIAFVQAEASDGEATPATRPYSINYSDRASTSGARQPLNFGQYMLNRTDSRHTPTSWSTPRRRGSIVVSQGNTERSTRSSAAYPSASLSAEFGMPLSVSPSRLPNSNLTETADDQSADPGGESGRTSAETPRSRQRRLNNENLRLSHLRSPIRPNGSSSSSSWRFTSTNHDDQISAQELTDNERSLREESRTWNRRIHELRERAGQINDSFNNSENDDMSFLDEVRNDIALGRENLNRARAALQRLSPDGEVSIQGIGWTWDGRYLIVGTEEGIMRYAVNIRGRMTMPTIRGC